MRVHPTTLAALTLWLGCSSLFTIRIRDESTSTVPAGTVVDSLIGDIGFDEFTAIDLTQSSELQNQGVAPGDISEVFLEELELEATAPDGADLSFIQSVAIYVEGPDLPRVLLASQDEFPDGQAAVQMDIEGVDLVEYAVSESMSFDVEMSGNRPEDATDVTARYTLAVGVTGQGACNAASSDGS